MIYLVVAFAFAAGFLFIFGMNMLIADLAEQRRLHLHDQLEFEHRLKYRERTRRTLAGQDGHVSLPGVEVTRDIAAPVSPGQRFIKMIEQSGLRVRPWQILLLSVAIGPLPALVVFAILQSWLIAIVLAFLGGALPIAFVAFKCRQRKEKLLSQLPDAFEMMSRVMRAGQTISQALLAVAEESTSPIAEEVGYCYEQQNLGLSSEAALQDLAHRTDLLEIKIFVVTLAVHRETGGNLSQLLDRLARVIRERFRIRGQIRALTAEGKLQAFILLALPFVVLGAMLVTSRDYLDPLFQYPSLLAVMVVADIIGALWMRAIINFDF